MPQKLTAILMLILTLFWGCSKKPGFVDTTKEARAKVLQTLKAFDTTPEKNRREDMVRLGHFSSMEYVDLHSFRLRVLTQALADENCFNLFTEQNNELALFFDALSNVPPKQIGKEMINCIEYGFYRNKPSNAKELEKLPIAELRARALKENLISRTDLYGAPEGYLRFALYLDGKVRPELKNDELYLFLREQLLASRPQLNRGAEDVFELFATGDSLFVEGDYMGSLAELVSLRESAVREQFNQKLEIYRRRNDKKVTVNGNYAEISPDFYEKKIKTRTVVLDDDSNLNKRNNTRSRVMKKGVFSQMNTITTGNPSIEIDPKPLLRKEVASITIDNSVSQNSLFKLLHLSQLSKLYDIQITSTSEKEALIRIHESGSAYSKELKLFKQSVEKKSKYNLLKAVLHRSSVAIINFTTPSITNDSLIATLSEISQDRDNVIYIDTSGTVPSIQDTLFYRITPKTLLGARDFILDQHRTVRENSNGSFGIRHGVGFGTGTGTGFSGKAGGVDDLLGTSTTVVRRRKPVTRNKASSAGMTGGRSRANIMRTVRNNMASLKYAYNRRLKAKPGIKGRVVVKWAIDEFGNVLHCRVVSSTMKDPTFEKEIVRKLKAWKYGKIAIPGDVTEVTYPFVFTQ